MISDDLANLADWCLGLGAMGGQMPPQQLADLARVLLDLSQRAKRLELAPFDPHYILDDDDE